MRTLLPSSSTPDPAADLERAYAWPVDRSWTRLNFIASVDGQTQGPDGRSGSLGTPADHTVFHLLRSTCDVVLVGAGTARAERYRPVRQEEVDEAVRSRSGRTALPVVAVVSRSLDLDARLLEGAAARTVVLTTADSPAERRKAAADVADVVVVGERSVDLASALAALRERGLHRVLCEGGPGLAHALLSAGQLDEICLTLRAMMIAGDGLRLITGAPIVPAVPLELCSLLADGSDLFLRYEISRSSR
jgi:riboflavin biosynthesis pyrimidine reductase